MSRMVRVIGVQVLGDFIERMEPAGWVAGDEALAEIRTYARADIQGDDIVTSTSYLKERAKASRFVCFHARGYPSTAPGFQAGRYLCNVQYYIKAVKHSSDNTLRLAVVDCYKAVEVQANLETPPGLWKVEDITQPDKAGVALEMDPDEVGKVMVADPSRTRLDHSQARYRVFWQYTTFSGR